MKEKLITKLYKGTCSRQELHLLLDLIREDPKWDDTEVMRKLWKELSAYPEIEEPLASELVQRTLAKIDKNETPEPMRLADRVDVRLIKLKRRRVMQFAGAAAVVMLIGALFWFWLSTEKLVTIQTTYAEQKTIKLPDQSIVKLNANSSLSFFKNWDNTEVRKAWLEGEAYFDVRRNEKTGQKFEVITNDLTVEVLGTIFNVNARKVSTRVFLEEGKVSLNLLELEQQIILEPGELVTYSRASGKSQKKRIEKEAPTSWKDGTASMTDVKLQEIIEKIYEIYDVTIVVENKAHLDRIFTYPLPVDNPEMGYRLLMELTGLEIERTGKKWTIK